MKLADVFAFLPLSPKSKVMGVTAHLCAMQAELTLHLTQPPQIPGPQQYSRIGLYLIQVIGIIIDLFLKFADMDSKYRL